MWVFWCLSWAKHFFPTKGRGMTGAEHVHAHSGCQRRLAGNPWAQQGSMGMRHGSGTGQKHPVSGHVQMPDLPLLTRRCSTPLSRYKVFHTQTSYSLQLIPHV